LNDQHSQGMSPQLYMSMYGLNNNVQHQQQRTTSTTTHNFNDNDNIDIIIS